MIITKNFFLIVGSSYTFELDQVIYFALTNGRFLYLFFYFILLFILLTRKKVTEALIHKVTNYLNLPPEMPKYCCLLEI